MQKHTPVIVSERSAFTLIEMIGVLAIMSILAAMIAPNVIKSIRESKISSAIASVNAAQIAATHYYQRYERIPADTEIIQVLNYKADPNGDPPQEYTPEVGNRDLGDMLVYQTQLLEQESVPIGRPTSTLTFAIGSSPVGTTLIGGVAYSGTVDSMIFDSAGKAVLVAYYFMPNLTTREAAGLAIKVNGPFGADALTELDFIEASLAGNGIAQKGGLEGANAWFTPGDQSGEYHAYVYVFHQ